MNWVASLQGLPLPIAILVVFTACIWFVFRAVFKRVVDPLAQSNKETAETIRKGLDANTEAVKESVEHNERIINNHLSGQEKRDAIVLDEMKELVTAIKSSNNRRRSDDQP